MADPISPTRWALKLDDMLVLDDEAVHLAMWACYYGRYASAPAVFTQILGATGIQNIPYDEATGRPQGWIFTLPECNFVVFTGLGYLLHDGVLFEPGKRARLQRAFDYYGYRVV